jgi:ABC transporter substrate binding protein
MRRRDFITLVGGGAAAWPLAARAQQLAMPVIGFLSGASFETMRDYVSAFHRGLADEGFAEGRNLAIEYRWAEDQNDRLPANIPQTATERAVIQDAARVLVARVVMLSASSPSEIESAFATLVREQLGALVVSGENFFLTQRNLLVKLAANHAVPTIYPYREFVLAGGLMSHGTHFSDAFRRIGVNTGRILKGKKAADLPVQQVTKIELAISLKTAKALGLTFPLPLLGRADEVIE